MCKEKEHFFECPHCKEMVDMRNLAQVFEHEHKNLSTPIWSSSIKVGEPIEYFDSKKVNLN